MNKGNKKSQTSKRPKLNQKHVREDTVVAKNYITRVHTVNKTKGDNVAWNQYLLQAVRKG